MQIPYNPYVRVVPVCYFFVVVFVLFFFSPKLLLEVGLPGLTIHSNTTQSCKENRGGVDPLSELVT